MKMGRRPRCSSVASRPTFMLPSKPRVPARLFPGLRREKVASFSGAGEAIFQELRARPETN
jgi:hypothetical protein